MAEESTDRERWDKRYSNGAYAERTHPSAYLVERLRQLDFGNLSPPSLALDVACGAGRNSIYLASRGFYVDGIDVSSVALGRASMEANQDATIAGRIHFTRTDLLANECELPRPGQCYDLIVIVRFVASDSISNRLFEKLKPDGGTMLIEEHLQWSGDDEVNGPGSPRFRVAPGALTSLAERQGLDVLHSYEGLVTDPDGSKAALSRITMRRVRTKK